MHIAAQIIQGFNIQYCSKNKTKQTNRTDVVTAGHHILTHLPCTCLDLESKNSSVFGRCREGWLNIIINIIIIIIIITPQLFKLFEVDPGFTTEHAMLS